jgi:hypothetical protein
MKQILKQQLFSFSKKTHFFSFTKKHLFGLFVCLQPASCKSDKGFSYHDAHRSDLEFDEKDFYLPSHVYLISFVIRLSYSCSRKKPL